jgi:putative membrane protein
MLAWVVANAVAVWVAVALVSGLGMTVPHSHHPTLVRVIGYVIVGVIIGIVNAVVGTVVKILSLPFILLTLGILLLVINALMLELAAWLTSGLDFRLHVHGFWAAFWGAIIISIVSWMARLVLDRAAD